MPFDLCFTTAKIKVEVEIRKPNQEPMVCFETLDPQIDLRSPWVGWRSLHIEGRRDVCTRTLPILSMRAWGKANPSKHDIPEGTTVKFFAY